MNILKLVAFALIGAIVPNLWANAKMSEAESPAPSAVQTVALIAHFPTSDARGSITGGLATPRSAIATVGDPLLWEAGPLGGIFSVDQVETEALRASGCPAVGAPMRNSHTARSVYFKETSTGCKAPSPENTGVFFKETSTGCRSTAWDRTAKIRADGPWWKRNE